MMYDRSTYTSGTKQQCRNSETNDKAAQNIARKLESGAPMDILQ